MIKTIPTLHTFLFQIVRVALFIFISINITACKYEAVEQSDINDSILDDLFHIVSAHTGDCQLKFELHDFKTKTKLKMPSRSMKVTIEKEFIKKLDNLEVFQYTLE